MNQLLAAGWSEVPLVSIKANVCRLLEPRLKDSGFKVLNKGRKVYFPSHGWQRVFCRQFREIVPQTLRGEELNAKP
jgi:hypothetical protein